MTDVMLMQTDTGLPPSSAASGNAWSRAKDALLSLIIAIPYAATFLTHIIRPTRVDWLGGDAATYYIAWAMFRLSEGFHWPLTFAPALGYPIGESISLFDNVPLLALLLRPISFILPTPFQYLGLYAVLCLVLQLYFGARLLRRLLPSNPTAVWLGAIFILVAPPMTYRLGGHFALSSHWLILASLLFYVRTVAGDYTPRSFAWRSVLLTSISAGVNPYITAMVVGVIAAALLGVAFQRRFSGTVALLLFAAIGASLLISAAAFGLIGSSTKDFTATGYRHFSMNLWAPLNPSPMISPILPTQPTFTGGQYEGYNYLGAGIVALLIVTVFTALTGRLKVSRAEVVAWVPVGLCAIGFTLMALSTLVTAGGRVILDLDPGQRFTPYLAAFRASGRFFWLAYYLLTILAITTVLRVLKARDAWTLLAAALALQLYDTQSVRNNVQTAVGGHPPPISLKSSVWSTLQEKHRNLVVLPAWQCESDTPGAGDGFRIFGLFAADHGLTINSYYSARYRQDTLKYHCETSIAQLSEKGLASGTAYVVSPRLAGLINNGPSGKNHCYLVDGFILCTNSGLPGQIPWHEGTGAPALPSMARPLTTQDSGFFVSGWTALEPGFGLWSTEKDAELVYQLPAQPASAVRLTLLAVTGKNPVRFSLTHEKGRFDGEIPAATQPTLQLFVVRLPIGTGAGIHRVALNSRQLLAPADQGYNADSRKMGIGIHAIMVDGCAPSSKIHLLSSDTSDLPCEIK